MKLKQLNTIIKILGELGAPRNITFLKAADLAAYIEERGVTSFEDAKKATEIFFGSF